MKKTKLFMLFDFNSCTFKYPHAVACGYHILGRATLETRKHIECKDTIDAIITDIEDPCNNDQV